MKTLAKTLRVLAVTLMMLLLMFFIREAFLFLILTPFLYWFVRWLLQRAKLENGNPYRVVGAAAVFLFSLWWAVGAVTIAILYSAWDTAGDERITLPKI